MQYISDNEQTEPAEQIVGIQPSASSHAELSHDSGEAMGASISPLHFMRDLLQVVLPAIILAIVVHLFLAQATVVFGQSMEPNLAPHQRLVVDKLTYRMRAPIRNDIIVLDLPNIEDMLVKRIVGLPGETIEIRDGIVLVDGQELPEPFPHDIGHATMYPLKLGALEYFVMGDNRDNSNDSRSFGPVERESIVGRVWLRYWPIDKITLF
jgi:signal peptidase I